MIPKGPTNSRKNFAQFSLAEPIRQDPIIPPLLYALVNMLAGLVPATLYAVVLAAFLTVLRLVRKQAWYYALSGLVLTLLAAGLAWYTQSASIFLPDLLTSAGLLAAALLSIWAGKPLAAWSSHLTRASAAGMVLASHNPPGLHRSRLDVRHVGSAARLAAQYALYQQGNASLLGWANVVLGWPEL